MPVTRTVYNKLVRDKIPEYIRSQGGEPVIHVASDEEYWSKLTEKLQEEVVEFMEDESIGEIADILEVIDAICGYKGFKREDVAAAKSKKAVDRGKFHDKIILEES